MLSVSLLFSLKLTDGALFYPIAIVLLIPLRWVLGKVIFRKDEMEAVSSPVAAGDALAVAQVS